MDFGLQAMGDCESGLSRASSTLTQPRLYAAVSQVCHMPRFTPSQPSDVTLSTCCSGSGSSPLGSGRVAHIMFHAELTSRCTCRASCCTPDCAGVDTGRPPPAPRRHCQVQLLFRQLRLQLGFMLSAHMYPADSSSAVAQCCSQGFARRMPDACRGNTTTAPPQIPLQL
jgi:hypothetical protein